MPPEAGYDFSIVVDLENLPAEQGQSLQRAYGSMEVTSRWHVEDKDNLIHEISLLKRNTMAAPFVRAFDEFLKMQEEASGYTRESAPEGVAEGGDVMAIHYREEEAIYIKASHDRVTVIFSTIFREETDRIFGKIFLQVSGQDVDVGDESPNADPGVRRCEEESDPECAASTLPKRATSRASKRPWPGRLE